jgi:hypothetical protein
MSSEQKADLEPIAEEQVPAIAPDKSLTLADRKLAGSAQCLNCGTELKGPFCYFCGQPDRNFMRFFPALLRDLMEDLLDLDSRFVRTLKPLLFKPGRLTRDYMNGRRFRYAPPMRVYIFSSIAFFLLAALLSSNSISPEVRDGNFIVISSDNEEDQKEVEEALSNLPANVREQIDVEQALEEVHNQETDEAGFKLDDISFRRLNRSMRTPT